MKGGMYMQVGDFVRVVNGKYVAAKGRLKGLNKQGNWIVNISGGNRISVPESALEEIAPPPATGGNYDR